MTRPGWRWWRRVCQDLPDQGRRPEGLPGRRGLALACWWRCASFLVPVLGLAAVGLYLPVPVVNVVGALLTVVWAWVAVEESDHLVPPRGAYDLAGALDDAGVGNQLVRVPCGEHLMDLNTEGAAARIYREGAVAFLTRHGLDPAA